jgi:hypothetical protein
MQVLTVKNQAINLNSLLVIGREKLQLLRY